MQKNNWLEIIKQALATLVPFLFGRVMEKNEAKENANELVKKAKKSCDVGRDNVDDKLHDKNL